MTTVKSQNVNQTNLQNQKRKHISFSEIRIWSECAFKHKLIYLDKIKEFKGNEFTAFGTAVHTVCENLLLTENINTESLFEKEFEKELSSLPTDLVLKEDLIRQMEKQGKDILPEVLPAVKEYFGEYEVVNTEEEIYELIETFGDDNNFKGFIDLVVKTPDGKYHIIDWKTCSWGWNLQKRTDKLITYQLTLYKHFFAKKHNIDTKLIETHFALLKRTSKKERVEIFRVTSGEKKTNNAMALLEKALNNIKRNRYIKNRLSCAKCEFHKTKHCP